MESPDTPELMTGPTVGPEHATSIGPCETLSYAMMRFGCVSARTELVPDADGQV